MGKLQLDPRVVRKARRLATQAPAPTCVRTVLRGITIYER